MKKHIKAPEYVTHLNDAPLLNEKIVHLKTTPNYKNVTHFYWNRSRLELIVGAKIHFPVISIAHIDSYKQSFYDPDREEIQMGDSVVWFFGKSIQPMVCATVIGVIKRRTGRYLRLQPNDPKSKVPETWAFYDPKRFFFISNNLAVRKLSTANDVYAVYQDELEKIEEIYGPIRSGRLLLRYMTNPHLALGEKAFRECHYELFRGIYPWAGQYRTHELVIGARAHPLMHPVKVRAAMKEFCHDFSNRYLRLAKSRKLMLDALVFAHKELAWIHPFEDGNGRTIRLYLELVAKTRGYEFDLTAAMSSNKKKRYYHFAVWKAVQGHTKILTALLDKALSDD